MYRIDSDGSVPAPPIPSPIGSEGFFKNTAGVNSGTLVDDDWLNMLQESLIALLDDQGVAHSKTNTGALLEAIESLVDERLALVSRAARGFMSGFYVTPTAGAATFTVDDGTCRDALNASYMRNAAGLKSKDCSVAWGTGVGALASLNTWADPYFGHLYAIGKPAPSLDINFGIDKSPTAANLLSDAAASGFTTYRQIGWVVRVGAGLLEFKQSRAWPQLWKLPEPRSPVDNVAVSVTTAVNHDVDVPEGTIHYGTHTAFTDGGGTSPVYGLLGQGETPPVTSATNYNYLHHRWTNDWRSESPTILGITTSGTATLQGRLTARFSSTSGSLRYYISTQGFLWDQRNV